MPFWIIALGLTAITGVFLALAMLRGRAGEVSAAEFDLKVYRDQLAEVDRDLARGLISAADAERTRTEISRRILSADAQIQRDNDDRQKTPKRSKIGVTLVVLTIGAGAVVIYMQLGKPGYPDLPLEERYEAAREALATRASQSAFEAQLPEQPMPEVDASFAALLDELRASVKDRPDDLRGHELLARNEATVQNFKAAYKAQERVISLKGESASSFDYTQLADLMIRAAQGYVSPEAEVALREALARDPSNGFARYYSGLIMSQSGRPDRTFRIWRDLLEEGPEAAPWIAPIRARIDDFAWIAGVTYTAPAPSGPSAADIEAAEDLSEDDRAAMIQGMVAGLAARLADEGGTPDEWAQLIGAYGVLGELEKAQLIWDEAQTVFDSAPEALSAINEAAQAAGLQN